MSHSTSNNESDLWSSIEYEELNDNGEKVKILFNLISTAELNKFTKTDPDCTLLHALIKRFDTENKYPELLNNLFKLENVDPQHVNINSKNPRTGTTALMLAASRGNLKLVQNLLYWKADPHAISENQMTPFSCACNRGNVEVAEFLSTYVTKEELELEQTYTGNTPKEELHEKIMDSPNQRKYHDLLKIICDIELKYLIKERIEAEATAYLTDTEE